MSKPKKIQIRNSTAEFLVFTSQAGENGIAVRVEDETVWLTQKLIAALFAVTVPTVNEHLKNIFAEGEVLEHSVIRKFRTTATDGKQYLTAYYNLDAIIAVGFRVNSARATQFRQWAIGILRDFAIRGYVLDKERLKNGAIFSITPAKLPPRSPKPSPSLSLKNTASCRTVSSSPTSTALSNNCAKKEARHDP